MTNVVLAVGNLRGVPSLFLQWQSGTSSTSKFLVAVNTNSNSTEWSFIPISTYISETKSAQFSMKYFVVLLIMHSGHRRRPTVG